MRLLAPGLCALFIGTAAGLVVSATPAASNPATTQSTGSREAVLQWQRAIYEGDEKKAEKPCWFATPECRIGWQARMGETMAEQRLREVATADLGEEPTLDSAYAQLMDYRSGRMNIGISAMQEKYAEQNLQRARVEETADKAVVSIGKTMEIHLIKDGTEWKVDCDQTLPNLSKLTPQQITQWNTLHAEVDKLTDEVKQKKYKNWTELRDRYTAIYKSLLHHAPTTQH